MPVRGQRLQLVVDRFYQPSRSDTCSKFILPVYPASSAQLYLIFDWYVRVSQELQTHRLTADPFLRRRAENLIKGLQRHLTDKDLLEQEQRESDMQSAYQQWKQIVEFCAEKERQLQLMQVSAVTHCQYPIQRFRCCDQALLNSDD
jgi:hypothetical protein